MLDVAKGLGTVQRGGGQRSLEKFHNLAVCTLHSPLSSGGEASRNGTVQITFLLVPLLLLQHWGKSRRSTRPGAGQILVVGRKGGGSRGLGETLPELPGWHARSL